MLRKRYPNGARKTWYSTATFAINGSITVGEAAVFDLRRKEGRHFVRVPYLPVEMMERAHVSRNSLKRANKI